MTDCNSPQPPQQGTCPQPLTTQGSCVGEREEAWIFSKNMSSRDKCSPVTSCSTFYVRTYVNVLTVASFRPTIGLSISRSRRLGHGDIWDLVSGAGTMWRGSNVRWLGRNVDFLCTSGFIITPFFPYRVWYAASVYTRIWIPTHSDTARLMDMSPRWPTEGKCGFSCSAIWSSYYW